MLNKVKRVKENSDKKEFKCRKRRFSEKKSRMHSAIRYLMFWVRTWVNSLKVVMN